MKSLLLVIVITLGLLFITSPVLAATKDVVCSGLSTTSSAVKCDTRDSDSIFTRIVEDVLNIMAFAIGAVSVVMIIIGGFRYVVSGGDSAGVEGAKNTILYAVIGLVVALLAKSIVVFVIGRF